MKDIKLIQDYDTPEGCWCIRFINTNSNNHQTQPLTREELKKIAKKILELFP